MKKILITLLTITISHLITPTVTAILDGRIAPIHLATRYTFTNFEWAKGNVFFDAGFDLPAGGTIFLDITQEVNGNINCKNGTLILLNDLFLATNVMITGSGFIDAQGRGIFLESDWTLSLSENYIFTSTVEIIGNQGNRINIIGAGPAGGIAFTNSASSVIFKNIQIGPFYDNNSFYTRYLAPRSLYFNNIDIILNIPCLELRSSLVGCYNTVNVVNSGPYDILISSSLDLYPYASCILGSQSRLQVRTLRASEASASLVLDNAQLEYFTSGTFTLMFSGTSPQAPHEGRCLIKGKSSLHAPAGTQLGLTNKSKLVFDVRSKLTMSPDITLSLY